MCVNRTNVTVCKGVVGGKSKDEKSLLSFLNKENGDHSMSD